MAQEERWPFSVEPPLPRRRDYPIAVVGAGSIVNDAHLPAYHKAGFQVIGIYDIRHERAVETAQRFAIPRVYQSLEELLASEAAIVDVAVPARENLAIARQVAASGKALLLQKPLAEDLATARAILACVEEAGIVAAVNQQARWMPAALAIRSLMRLGLLGTVYQISFLINVETPWHLWPWILEGPTVEVMYHSIHYLDTIRSLVQQEPRLLFADGTTLPGYASNGETRTLLHLIFDGHLRATVLDNHHNSGGLEDQYATLRVEGTEGTAVAELGLLKHYPTGVPDHFRYRSSHIYGGAWISPRLPGSWFPDAFIGTMASVMRGLEGEPGAPETSIRDNVRTLQLVMAAYASMRQRCPIDPATL
ncbi:Gfo/Idh/MocA family protein [Thermogemmatispora onikobensis]|uniref:Gfo/Idh/MocA family protein n=1 Tax=Thermogemmatispora onikobensis TaxID=732234 RepID=UPI000853A2D9|nr:Gfo/Idh/MocA family oxidoreductase [Thermogemmatispora onikobensis]